MLTIVTLIDFIDREIEQAKSCVDNATTEYSTHRNEGAILALKTIRDYISNNSVVEQRQYLQKFQGINEYNIVECIRSMNFDLSELPNGMPPNCS